MKKYPISNKTAPLPWDVPPRAKRLADVLARAGVRGFTLEDLELAALYNALRETAGHRTRAAEMLGISLRTLQRKFKALNSPD